MLIEYPSYMEAFHCVGGSCPDTCCAGWIVDVDEESYYYYQTVPGKFGERLRGHLREDADGAKYFPMTREKRCPFLNRQNLCDIFTELGEDRLCQVCTEYPRWYTRVGYYEQQDLSLSCMEAARLFFTVPEISYCRAMSADPGEGLTPEEEEALVQTLAVRNEGLEILQEEGLLQTKLEQLRSLSELTNEKRPASEAAFSETLVQQLEQLDPLNDGWKAIMQSLRSLYSSQTAQERTAAALGLLRESSEYQAWFTRLAMYFWFRYLLDGVLQYRRDSMAGSCFERGYRMMVHSLHTIELMCAARVLKNCGAVWPKTLSSVFTAEDMTDVAHIFSKEVEHDAKNLEILQWQKKGDACYTRKSVQ